MSGKPTRGEEQKAKSKGDRLAPLLARPAGAEVLQHRLPGWPTSPSDSENHWPIQVDKLFPRGAIGQVFYLKNQAFACLAIRVGI